MIPLSRWLVDRESTQDISIPHSQTLVDDKSTQTAPADDQPDIAISRINALEAALQTAEDALTKQQHAYAERERTLREELSAGTIDTIRASIDHGFAVLSQEIEKALTDILQPFLEQRSIAKAIEELLALITKEIQNDREPLLKLCVPQELHELIQPGLEQMKLSAELSEGHNIKLIFPTRTVCFEQLASIWRNIISDNGR